MKGELKNIDDDDEPDEVVDDDSEEDEVIQQKTKSPRYGHSSTMKDNLLSISLTISLLKIKQKKLFVYQKRKHFEVSKCLLMIIHI